MKPVKDDDGEIINEGDSVNFSYGIPPVGVTGKVVQDGGELVVLTPGHKPAECRLRLLKKYVGNIYKVKA